MNSMFLQFVMESPTFDFADSRALPALTSRIQTAGSRKIQGFHPASFGPNQL